MTTHTVEPGAGFVHFDFDRAREPALWIESGDVVRFRTLDADANLEKMRPDGSQPHFEPRSNGHALCGPVGIRGARAGQTLEVEIHDIRTGTWGWTGSGGFSTPLNDRLGVTSNDRITMIWTIDPDALTAVNQWGH